MGGKAYGHSDSRAGGASVQNFSDSSGKPSSVMRFVPVIAIRLPSSVDQVIATKRVRTAGYPVPTP